MSQHYEFAHRAFPQLVFETPADKLRGLLTGDFADHFLEDVWHDLGEPPERDEPDDMDEFMDALLAGEIDTGPDPEAPKASEVEVAGRKAVLVTMAPPSQPVEAHFLLVTLAPEVRYFSLEKQVDEEDAGAVVCEWKIDDDGERHINYGSIPSVESDSFVAKVEELLEG